MNVCLRVRACESNQGKNGHVNREHQCRNNTPFHTPEGESISAAFDSNPYQLAPELQPSALSPPPQLRMMDYHHWQPRRVLEGERRGGCRERGGIKVGGWVGKVSHYRDTFIGGECWVKELWFDKDLGWIGEGKGFFKGQGIQSQPDSMASHPQNAGVYRDFSQGHSFRLILLSLTCPPRPLDSE